MGAGDEFPCGVVRCEDGSEGAFLVVGGDDESLSFGGFGDRNDVTRVVANADDGGLGEAVGAQLGEVVFEA